MKAKFCASRQICPELFFVDVESMLSVDTWSAPSLLVATNNHILKLIPDAVGLHTYEVMVAMDSNITALCVDVAAKMLYFATASPAGLHGLTVSSGNIFAVSLQNPATPCDIEPLISGFYPPKSGIEIGRNFSPVLGSGSPQFLTQVSPSILSFFPTMEKVLLKV